MASVVDSGAGVEGKRGREGIGRMAKVDEGEAGGAEGWRDGHGRRRRERKEGELWGTVYE